MRIDVYVAENAGITRSAAQKLIKSGGVLVNGKLVKSNYILRGGDDITWDIPAAVSYEAAAENIPLDIVYEDGDVIVINKPQGMVVHPAFGHFDGTLVNALLHHCGGSLSGINGVMRPGIVHRIDKDTSGLLVAAKNDGAHQALAAQLAEHSMERTYMAVCFNNIKEDSFTVDLPIGRHPSDRKKMTVISPAVPPAGKRGGGSGSSSADGSDSPQKKSRRAVTHITVTERYGKFTLIEAKLETGRTHQIRVHMSHIGHPILGDKVYGPERQPFALNGQVLHAKSLGFVHPATGEIMRFDSPLPEYFENALKRLRV